MGSWASRGRRAVPSRPPSPEDPFEFAAPARVEATNRRRAVWRDHPDDLEMFTRVFPGVNHRLGRHMLHYWAKCTALSMARAHFGHELPPVELFDDYLSRAYRELTRQ